jgi:hypothetical protein
MHILPWKNRPENVFYLFKNVSSSTYVGSKSTEKWTRVEKVRIWDGVKGKTNIEEDRKNDIKNEGES